ncbi:hypothetical protein ACU8L2_01205 [Rhizobium leguminosarum]
MKKPFPPHKSKPKKPVNKAPVTGSKKGKNARAITASVAFKNSSNPKISRIIETRDSLQKEKHAHRKFIWKTIADACIFGNELTNDEEAWQQFCALDWGKLRGPKVNQRDQAIRFAMKFIFAKGKKGEKRASFYYNAVIGLVQQGLEGKALAKAIASAGGLKKLQSQKPSKSKSREKLEGVFENSEISDFVGDLSSSDDDDDDDDYGDSDDAMARRCEMLIRKGEDNDGDDGTMPEQDNGSVEMPFTLIFPKSPSSLTRAKLPARVVIKGHVVSFGKSSIFKVDRHKVKKPKI